jgi:hypothetical protein
MTKSPKGRGIAPLFSALGTERTSTKRKSQRRARAGGLVDAIVGGERVVLAHPSKPESERNVEIQVRVALAAAGVMVMKHSVEPCRECGSRPGSRQGLGIGCSDLICIVPPYGRFLGIEMKRPGYSPSMVKEHQRRWLAVVRRFGGITGVASSVEEAMALVKEARGLPCT